MTERRIPLTWDTVGESLANQIEQHAAGTYEEITGFGKCKYFSSGDKAQAACLIGRVLADHGVTRDWLVYHPVDVPNPVDENQMRLSMLVEAHQDWFEGVDRHLVAFLGKAQFLQDNGFTWLDSVRLAMENSWDDLEDKYGGVEKEDVPRIKDPMSESFRMEVKQLLEELRGPFPALMKPVPDA